MKDVLKQRERTPHVILIGDFNISFTKLDSWPRLRSEEIHTLPRQLFIEEIMPGMGVVDVFRRMYGPVEAFSWFNRGEAPGKARVDYALVTEAAVPAVTKMRYMPEQIGESDHCPVVLDLDRRKLQGLPYADSAGPRDAAPAQQGDQGSRPVEPPPSERSRVDKGPSVFDLDDD